MTLPIDAVLPDVIEALRQSGRAVLEAPPGAGKTTRVPLAILEAGLAGNGRILMLEPRRLAARAAAERMAQLLGEEPGGRVGFRVRGEAAVSDRTRIEVVTEGILTRMLQDNPELPGVSVVIFDEFHERSLNADLGLALTWEARSALREDLKIVVMSATLDAGPVAAMLDDAPRISSEGRAFPVETRWRAAPPRPDRRFEAEIAELVQTAIAKTEGGILVFLPGEGEIRRVQAALSPVPADLVIQPLYGALPLADQRKAIRPLKTGRKLVLATAIAETSLTIEDIRVVVDGGRARRARYDPGSGMTRLVTEPVSRAEADQRRGRAGRVAEGICYRNWTKGGEGALPLFPPAEIETADLAGLALELALWGGAQGLRFLTDPPEGAMAEAQALLEGLGALQDNGQITDHGRKLSAMPLHPRLAHMLARGGNGAAEMAALLSERDPLRGAGADLGLRLRALRDGQGDRAVSARIKSETKRLSRFAAGADQPPECLAALAYPDRIALRRAGDAPRYLLSGGKGAAMDPGDGLAGQRLLVVTDLDGDRREARIRSALPISEAQVRNLFGDQISWINDCHWSRRDGQVRARQQERLGSLVLDDRHWRDPPPDAMAMALLDGIRDLGLGALNWTDAARRLRARIALAGLCDVSDAALIDSLETWALPFLGGLHTAGQLRKWDPKQALEAMIGWDGLQQLEALVPAAWQSPLGRAVPIDYSGETPEVSLRLQEVFGTTEHPKVGPEKVPLKMVLLSPAQRPVQVTTDLPGFWDGSYADVRKDMRARYPKHPWPDDPRAAPPTLRAKPRR